MHFLPGLAKNENLIFFCSCCFVCVLGEEHVTSINNLPSFFFFFSGGQLLWLLVIILYLCSGLLGVSTYQKSTFSVSISSIPFPCVKHIRWSDFWSVERGISTLRNALSILTANSLYATYLSTLPLNPKLGTLGIFSESYSIIPLGRYSMLKSLQTKLIP